jgi:hypothetical protein
VGDGGDGGAAAKALAARIASERPDHFLYLGDVYEAGTRGEFKRNYRSVYRRLHRITAPTPGNHEWPNADEGYKPYWHRVRGRSIRSYYSFRAGGWEILSSTRRPAIAGVRPSCGGFVVPLPNPETAASPSGTAQG